MASDETMMSSTIDSSFQDEEEEEEFEDDNIGDHHHHTNPHNLSRLSVCTTSSTMCGVEDDVDNLASMCMSHLSIESFEGGDNGGGVEADGEFSDGKEEEDNINYLLQTGGLSSDENYDELLGSCYSLPARRKNETQTLPSIGVKEYASENEAKKETKSKRRRRRRVRRDTWVGEKENIWGVNSNEDKKKEKGDISGSNGTAAAAAGLMVITRPKGGNRSLCMDLEEVKACRDLGFELEHERMLEIINPPNPSSRLSFSNSTSSGGNSPIANWRISAPGDDPRDVKARLKMWAQAVALASASSKYSS